MSKSKELKLLVTMFIATLSIACYIAFSYSSNPTLDLHAFRQSQTALTSYWFMREGFKINYQTPVAGIPWSIPFEFPIYQAIVATTADLLHANLNTIGRITSFLFLALTLAPAYIINKGLRLPSSVYATFGIILFTSPIYLYWGRSFMIETTAVFLAISSMACFVRCGYNGYSYRYFIGYIIFSALGLLQKATTALPAHLIMSGVLLYAIHREWGIRFVTQPRPLLKLLLFVLFPLIVAALWIQYTDSIKSTNPLGRELTSSALRDWNWGTAEQRFSFDIYFTVLYLRIIRGSLGGVLGVFLLLITAARSVERDIKIVIWISIALGLLPLLLFTPLHIEHEYYQSANVIYLIYATSVSIIMVAPQVTGLRTVLPILSLITLSNYMFFYKSYWPHIASSPSHTNRDYEVGLIIKKNLSQDEQFVAFGNDWNSTLSYISERKSFTVPRWFKDYQKVMANPENYVEPDRFGGLIFCNPTEEEMHSLLNWLKINPKWKSDHIRSCYISTKEKPYDYRYTKRGSCRASLNMKEIFRDLSTIAMNVSGEVSMEGTDYGEVDVAYLNLHQNNEPTQRAQALIIPKANTSTRSKGDNSVEFSRILILPQEIELKEITVTLIRGGSPEDCALKVSHHHD